MAQAINERLFGASKIDPDAASKGWVIGKDAGQMSSQASPAAFVNTAVDKYKESQLQRAQIQQEQQKARASKLQRMLMEANQIKTGLASKYAMGGNLTPQELAQANNADQFIKSFESNPMMQQLVGLDPDKGTSGFSSDMLNKMGFTPSKFTSGGVTYESSNTAQNERADEARKIDFNLAAKANEDMAVIDSSVGILEDLFNKAVPDPSKVGTEAIFGGAVEGIKANVGLNENLRSFKNVKDSMASLFSKGLFREAGVLTNQDIKRAMAALPNEQDSAVTLQNKLKALKKLVNTAKQNYAMKRESFISGKDFTPIDSGLVEFDTPEDSGGIDYNSALKAAGL